MGGEHETASASHSNAGEWGKEQSATRHEPKEDGTIIGKTWTFHKRQLLHVPNKHRGSLMFCSLHMTCYVGSYRVKVFCDCVYGKVGENFHTELKYIQANDSFLWLRD